ncbi:MAG: hypothetical protein FWF15_11890 [Oscillospiraceae bacterium]|nr:hypothetical protein [Oscillospiraceae bacterium]
MKKSSIVALILVTCFICIICLSCAQENEKAEQTTLPKNEIVPETELERPSIPAGTDYGGYNFRVSVPEFGLSVIDFHREIFVEEQSGDTMDDAVYMRNRLIEEMLNFNISIIVGTGHWLVAHPAAILKVILAGDDVFDIIDGAYQPMLAYNGALVNLYNVPNIDLSKPWWDQRMIEDLSFRKSKLYYLIGDIGHCGMSGVMSMLFNKQMFDDYGFKYPYEKVRQGTWVFDDFAKLIRDVALDLNGDGIMDHNDQWGLYGNSGSVLWFMLGSGEKVISLDKDGIPCINSLNDRHVQVLSKIGNLFSDKNYVILAENIKGGPDPYEALESGRAAGRFLFFYTTVAGISTLRSFEYDFGVLPFPKSDENLPEYCSPATSYSSGASAISIPVTNLNLERTGMILEAMSGYSTDIIIPALIDVALKSKYTRDAESGEMIELILRTKFFDMLMEYGWGRLSWGSLYYDVYSNLNMKGSETFVSDIEKQLPKSEADTESFTDIFDEFNY